MSIPMIILVHGAWHSTACFHALLPHLKAVGLKGHVPARPSVGDKAAEFGLDDDTRMLKEVIEACADTGEHIFIVAHSSAGFVVPPAIEGLTLRQRREEGKHGGVIGIGMISAFIAPEEGFMFQGLEWNAAGFEFRPDGTTVPVGPADMFYNDLPEQEQKRWVDALRPTGIGERKLTYLGWKDVPLWYLVCTQDNANKVDVQRGMIEKAREQGANITVQDIESSHSPFLSKPNETAGWLIVSARDAALRAQQIAVPDPEAR